MKNFKVAQMREPVVFQRLVKGEKTRYSNENTYVEAYRDRGKLETRSGVTDVQGENPNVIRTHVLICRFRKDADASLRVFIDDRYFKTVILNMIDEGTHKYHEFVLDEEKQEIT